MTGNINLPGLMTETSSSFREIGEGSWINQHEVLVEKIFSLWKGKKSDLFDFVGRFVGVPDPAYLNIQQARQVVEELERMNRQMGGEKFRELCEVCYGIYWIQDAAVALGISEQEVQNLAMGGQIPDGIAAAIMAIAKQKRDCLSQLTG